MNADFLYRSAPGRILFQALQKAGAFRLAARFLHSRASRRMIPGYIEKNGIDMSPFAGQAYDSFASFFARKREDVPFASDPRTLISPCDSLLSVYPVTGDLSIPMKGSVYSLPDLLPDSALAASFQNGLCLVFRLEASDYHHFCCFDDGRLTASGFLAGQLHSVQPVALEQFPVFRLNRRWWSVLETAHFGRAVQIEVGAMAVGGVSFSIGKGSFRRGDDMGNFELAGSTVLLFLEPSVRKHLILSDSVTPALDGKTEVRVKIGSAIGTLQNE